MGPNILTYQDDSLPENTYEYYLDPIYIGYSDIPTHSIPTTCTIEFSVPENVTTTTYGSDILLEWTFDPLTQRDLLGFRVYKDGCMLAENITEFLYLDVNVPSGTYVYNVSAIFSGNFESELSEGVIIEHIGTSENETQSIENNFSNFPNPFNPSTEIRFQVSAYSEDSRIEIYNLQGQKIRQYSISTIQSSIIWDGTDQNGNPVASGIYLYRLKAGDVDVSKKCLLLK